jgi:hypothetical protein
MIQYHQGCVRAIVDRLWKHRPIGQMGLPIHSARFGSLTSISIAFTPPMIAAIVSLTACRRLRKIQDSPG